MFIGALVVSAIGLIFAASQIFWIRRMREWGALLIPRASWRRWVGPMALGIYFFLFAVTFLRLGRGVEPTRMTLQAALFEAPFPWWLVCSTLGFALAVLFWLADRLGSGIRWGYRKLASAPKPDPPSPGRRRFLEQTAYAVCAAPFVAGAYALFYGRLNLQVTRQRIKLPRLPKAFHGFRIAQLTDIHIGPFMPAEEIRKYVAICNQLKPDLVALTGDFITWDPSTQGAVAEELSGLRAPFGVFGSLGNHELWTDTEESISRLFAERGIPILRQQRAAIQSQGETINLIGVDYQSLRGARTHGGHVVPQYLAGIEPLVMPDTANILLSHNPNTFDRAAELGIDLSLAGHTHGGQVTLEFIHPSLTPSRLITDYVRGWFGKPGGQLYVNRGIGTIFVPMRLDAPPEITLFELLRA